MRILLDTQVFLHAHAAPKKLPRSFARALVDARNELHLSVASAWEIAVKHGIGKLPLPEPPAAWLPARMAASGVRPLDVTLAHALHVEELPRHHADPFDRMIVAQARVERMRLMTLDDQLAAYDVDRVRR